MSLFWTAVGIAAAALTSFGFLPQIRKMWRTRCVRDVSLGTFLQFSAGVSLWALYGLGRSDPVIVIANLITLGTLIAGLAFYHRFRKNMHPAMPGAAETSPPEPGSPGASMGGKARKQGTEPTDVDFAPPDERSA